MRLPWKKASSAPLRTGTGKGNHNFANVVRALHLTLKWREDYLSFIIYFNQPSATLAELKTVFTSKRNIGANYLSSMRPSNIIYFLRETTHICKYLKIHRLSWAIYILPLSIGLRQIDSFIDSIQWLFSAVCLALNAGKETATSNRCYLRYCFKLCLCNHTFIKQFHRTTYSAWGGNGA